VLLILTPLFVGLSWTFAFATLTFGSLNILTGLIGAVLLGLGIDHGIHLLSGYECAVAEGQSAADALAHTFSQTGRAVLFAALTTGVGFSGPALSELRAFHEFGAIAAAGMVFIVLSYLTLLPTLLGLAHRLGWQPSPSNADSADRPNRIGLTHGRPAMALSVVALILVVLGLRHTSFNYDFSGLEGGTHLRSVILNDEVTRVLGHSTSTILVLADDAADAQRIAASLRANQERLGPHSTIDFVATRADVVPPNQRAKAAIIAEIYAVTKKVRGRSLPRSLRKKLRKLKVMAAQQPFTMKDVPRGVQQQFETRDGSPADGFLLVYPRVALDQGLLVQKLARELRSVPMPKGKTISVASESMVLADILTMIFQEGPRVLSVTLVAVFFTVLILLRSWRDTF
jgi:predicted RND superfamily exporter protein